MSGKVEDPSGMTRQIQDFSFVYDMSKTKVGEINIKLIFYMPDKMENCIMDMVMKKK